MKLELIKNLIQSCNLNFLIGSGISSPYLSTLGNIETVLTEVEKNDNNQENKIIKASLYKKYCEDVIFRNLVPVINKYKEEYLGKNESELVDDKYLQYKVVLESYKNLVLNINEILLFRHNNLITKQVNLFTTNIDIFLEKSLEQTNLEFNDGFKGRSNPIYDLSNFQKSYSKTSPHYDNISEIPVFNLLKVHGSINWDKNEAGKIIYKYSAQNISNIRKELSKIPEENFIKIVGNETYEDLLLKTSEIELDNDNIYNSFFETYANLIVINPTKEKFERTVLDEEYYELLRIYANSLEKENTILFVLGFSFADEHIRNITIRASNSNPTLQVIIFVHKNEEQETLLSKLNNIRNNNIQFVTPKSFIDANSEIDEKQNPNKKKLSDRLKSFDCKTINEEIFGEIKNTVRYNKLTK